MTLCVSSKNRNENTGAQASVNTACAVKLDYNQAGALDTDHTYAAQPGHSTWAMDTDYPSAVASVCAPGAFLTPWQSHARGSSQSEKASVQRGSKIL